MKQLLILSGKGGTGKTTIACAFIKLSEAKNYADCDVDAPNLHLVTGHTAEPRRTDYYGLPKAEINRETCIACGECMQNCRFDAIHADDGGYHIDLYGCEGCGVCEAICPADAITMNPAAAGELMLYNDGQTNFSTAQLKMGSGTSGKLVTEVKKQMKAAALPDDFAIIDGSPGIGCPVIASLSGVDLVLIVSEPSVSGISDMERIIKTARGFHTSTAVCINKSDTNEEKSREIEKYCETNGLPFTGKIPFDPEAVKAVNRGLSITETDCKAGRAVKDIYTKTMNLLFKNSQEK